MMSSTNDEDPFLQVQQEVLSQLSTSRSLFSSYLRIKSLSPSSTSPELASARQDLETALENLGEDLEDLAQAVRAAERDPGAFGLDGVEVSRRRRLVQEAGAEIEDMREELVKASAKPDSAAVTGVQADPFGKRDAGGLPHPNAFALDYDGAGGGRGAGSADYAAEFEHQTQMQMMREQDEQLDSVYVTVGNLRRQADDMGRELEEQAQMLDEVDGLADRVGGRLQTGMDKMKHVIRKNEDSLSSCCIAVLITILIIILVLLVVL